MVSDDVSSHFGDVLDLRRGLRNIVNHTKLGCVIQVWDGCRASVDLLLEDAAGFLRWVILTGIGLGLCADLNVAFKYIYC